jgi:hypothetical protein
MLCQQNLMNPHNPCAGYVITPSSSSASTYCTLATLIANPVNIVPPPSQSKSTTCVSQTYPIIMPAFAGMTNNGAYSTPLPQGKGYYLNSSSTIVNMLAAFQSTGCSGWTASLQYNDKTAVSTSSLGTPFLQYISNYQGPAWVSAPLATGATTTIKGDWLSITFPDSQTFISQISFSASLQNTTTGGLGLPYSITLINVPSSFVPSGNSFQCPPSGSTVLQTFTNGPSQVFLPSTYSGGKWGYGNVTVSFILDQVYGPLQQLVVVIPQIVGGSMGNQMQLYSCTLGGQGPYQMMATNNKILC